MNVIAHKGQNFAHRNGDEYEVVKITSHTITLMELSGELMEIDMDDFLDHLRNGILEPISEEDELEEIVTNVEDE